MPLIEPETQPMKNEQLNVRIDPEVVATLRNYCEFLKSSSQHHVVEQSLRYVFGRDTDFQSWLSDHWRAEDGVQDRVLVGGDCIC